MKQFQLPQHQNSTTPQLSNRSNKENILSSSTPNKSLTKSVISYNSSELSELKHAALVTASSQTTIQNNNTVQEPSTSILSIQDISQLPSTSPSTPKVIFIFTSTPLSPNTNLHYELSFTLKHCPLLSSHLSKLTLNPSNNVIINLPNWIYHENIIEYFHYVNIHSSNKTKSTLQTFSYNYTSIIKVSEFFKNDNITSYIIINELITNISFSNAMDYLEMAFDYLTVGYDEPKHFWLELFVKSIDYISKNLHSYLMSDGNKIRNLNNKLQHEIIEKYLSNKQTYCINDKSIIDFILYIKHTTNIPDTIINEYLYSLSNEHLTEIININTEPTLNTDIDVDRNDNIYMEIPIQNFHPLFSLTAVISYKKYDNYIKINIKLDKPNTQTLHFYTISLVSIVIMNSISSSIKQSHLITLSHISNNANIYNHYLSYRNVFTPVTFNIYLKFNCVHTTLVNYFIVNCKELYNDNSIYKIGKELLREVMLCVKYYNNNISDDKINEMFYTMLCLWLNDEVNVHSENNLKELFECVDWTKVKIENVISFYIKYKGVIERNRMKDMFSSIMKEYNNVNISKVIDLVSDDIDYMSKMSMIYKFQKERNDNITPNNNNAFQFKVSDDISAININKSRLEKFLIDDMKPPYLISNALSFNIIPKQQGFSSQHTSQYSRSVGFTNLKMFSYHDTFSSNEFPKANSLTINTNWNTMSNSNCENNHKKIAPTATYSKYKNNYKLNAKLKFKQQQNNMFTSTVIQGSKLSKMSPISVGGNNHINSNSLLSSDVSITSRNVNSNGNLKEQSKTVNNLKSGNFGGNGSKVSFENGKSITILSTATNNNTSRNREVFRDGCSHSSRRITNGGGVSLSKTNSSLNNMKIAQQTKQLIKSKVSNSNNNSHCNSNCNRMMKPLIKSKNKIHCVNSINKKNNNNRLVFK